jgi:hypothetical protein
MRGALQNRKIKKAFEILKEGKTDWLESKEAF